MNINKKLFTGITIFALALSFVQNRFEKSYPTLKQSSFIKSEQTAVKQNKEPVDLPLNVQKMYVEDQLIGVVHNLEYINKKIRKEGKKIFQNDFPDSSISLSDQVYFTEDISYLKYENIDEEITNYLLNKELLSVEVNRIEFSNGAVIYVKDLGVYEEAKEEFLLNFVDKNDLVKLINNEEIVRDEAYGPLVVDLEVLEKTIITKGFTDSDNVYTDKKDILDFFSYGFSTEKEYYTVEAFDTIEGVASKNGLTAQQVVTINPDIKSKNQLIEEGEQLNVTYFKSPINVVVKKENIKDEIIYPDEPLLVEDNSIAEGKTKVTVKEEVGKRKVTYIETYVNGVLQDGAQEVSSETIKEPVREVIKVGTYVEPRVGSGNFRYPVNNQMISCGWYCYAGHAAIDVQNRANFYGDVVASDRGVVVTASYGSINGYYVEIDHNNGYTTYYGHLHRPPYVSVGDVVAKGEVIGQIGMTGFATGPHVHFEIRYNGVKINPCSKLGC